MADDSPEPTATAMVASVTRIAGTQSSWTEKLLRSMAPARRDFDAHAAYFEEAGLVEGAWDEKRT